jgi:hypothetical protein
MKFVKRAVLGLAICATLGVLPLLALGADEPNALPTKTFKPSAARLRFVADSKAYVPEPHPVATEILNDVGLGPYDQAYKQHIGQSK